MGLCAHCFQRKGSLPEQGQRPGNAPPGPSARRHHLAYGSGGRCPQEPHHQQGAYFVVPLMVVSFQELRVIHQGSSVGQLVILEDPPWTASVGVAHSPQSHPVLVFLPWGSVVAPCLGGLSGGGPFGAFSAEMPQLATPKTCSRRGTA